MGREEPHVQAKAASDEALTIRAKRHVGDPAPQTRNRMQELPLFRIPHLERSSRVCLVTSTDDALAVGAEGGLVNPAGEPLQGEEFLPCPRVPQLYLARFILQSR